jgi:hypothetical protein
MKRLEFSCFKGQCHKVFNFMFFHKSVSPKPLSILLGPFQILSKIFGDIRSSRCTRVSLTPVVNGKNFKKILCLDNFGL